MAKDFFGNELQAGDAIKFKDERYKILKGTVVETSDNTVKISYIDEIDGRKCNTKKPSKQVIKI